MDGLLIFAVDVTDQVLKRREAEAARRLRVLTERQDRSRSALGIVCLPDS
ncbi:MAG TPA: hypothetical protein VEA99_05600 [Gemmatimonadaceae bacterium]|nr:hypothetical protein [Gemmatimonadaceae bacterium]